ncbi:MAG: DEAD/DEAH box helicase, partial [Acidobacteriota bacterium]|nr:DEAD/DEAH box helicase [Acidobacteriota bacterium]
MSRKPAFERLHPALQHHIVNSLGWKSLRPLQEQAIGPVLDGDHALLLAPTAGGKTEAAVFPLLSRMLTERWVGLSVLYVCPIKALLNNVESRLRAYGTLVGRRVGLWHGDVGAARRWAILRDRPDLLLTTPESIEVMLVSRRSEPRLLFRDLQAVVVDELHAFAGDDRGWHLLAVLERVRRLAGREIQRLGLSATVANPEALLEWLAPAASQPRQVIAPAGEASRSATVHLDYVGSTANAARVLSALHRGEKRLVFCDSRARVEALAAELRQAGTETFVSHSSLGMDERRRSEEA